MQTDRRVKDYQEHVYQTMLDRLTMKAEQKAREGYFPYDGLWRTVDDIRKYQRIQKKLDREACIEIMFLLFGLFILSMIGLTILL